MAELITFLRSFCKAIGRSEFVDPGAGSLGQPVRDLLLNRRSAAELFMGQPQYEEAFDPLPFLFAIGEFRRGV
jgi:hypothetical protein